jgi:zinc protease
VTYDLPKNYFNQYVQAIETVGARDVVNAAQKYIQPNNMLFVIVGDVDKIEPGIRELNLGEIHYLDLDGNSVNR